MYCHFLIIPTEHSLSKHIFYFPPFIISTHTTVGKIINILFMFHYFYSNVTQNDEEIRIERSINYRKSRYQYENMDVYHCFNNKK